MPVKLMSTSHCSVWELRLATAVLIIDPVISAGAQYVAAIGIARVVRQ